MRKKTGPGKNDGFTLVEVMITILILVIGLLGTAGVVIMVIKANSFSKQISTATVLAESKMEELKHTPYGSLAGGSDTPVNSPVYNRSWTVQPETPIPDTSTVQVTVAFSWNNQPHTVQLRTFMRRP